MAVDNTVGLALNPFLMLAHPRIAASRIEGPTSLIDIAPTILDFLGVPYDALPGKSLLGSGLMAPQQTGYYSTRHRPRRMTRHRSVTISTDLWDNFVDNSLGLLGGPRFSVHTSALLTD